MSKKLLLGIELTDDASEVIFNVGFVAYGFEEGGAEELILAVHESFADRLLNTGVTEFALAGGFL